MQHPRQRPWDDLLDAALELSVCPGDFVPVAAAEAEAVVSGIQARFGNSVDLYWWPSGTVCELPRAARHFVDQRGFERLSQIVPDPHESVWFVTEDWGRGKPGWFLFEGHPAVIQRLLGECFGFE